MGSVSPEPKPVDGARPAQPDALSSDMPIGCDAAADFVPFPLGKEAPITPPVPGGAATEPRSAKEPSRTTCVTRLPYIEHKIEQQNQHGAGTRVVKRRLGLRIFRAPVRSPC